MYFLYFLKITQMTKHKTEDYKNSAVKYYFNNENGDGYKKTYKIFDCKKSTLRDWIKDTKLLKILQEKTENLFLIKLQNHK